MNSCYPFSYRGRGLTVTGFTIIHPSISSGGCMTSLSAGHDGQWGQQLADDWRPGHSGHGEAKNMFPFFGV